MNGGVYHTMWTVILNEAVLKRRAVIGVVRSHPRLSRLSCNADPEELYLPTTKSLPSSLAPPALPQPDPAATRGAHTHRPSAGEVCPGEQDRRTTKELNNS